MRLAFIVSHPIQYYVPIYRDLAKRIRQVDESSRDQETAEAEPNRRWPQGKQAAAAANGLRDQELKRLKDEETKGLEDEEHITALKVFYTWRDAGPARDVKFGKEFAWDIPLMEGYDFEVVPNASPDPGTHHRQGLINPDLVARVKAWQPDAVHITGYNYVSHGKAIKELSEAGIPVIFRGDSHLLDGRGPWWKWMMKKCWLSKVYRWPSAFAYVGQANRDYYRAFRVPERKLFHVPHTIEVGRFAEPNEELEAKALAWRRELGIPDEHFVFLYAAKLEPRKRPMELLEAFLRADLPRATLLFVGSGELEDALKKRVFESSQSSVVSSQEKTAEAEPNRRWPQGKQAAAAANEPKDHGTMGPRDEEPKSASADEDSASPAHAGRGQTEDCQLKTDDCGHRVVFLEFQNQSAMPVVYRLGDVLVLPSGYGETWGLAVNEAQACGRPALVSDCVGCARDIVRDGENGMVFRTDDWEDCVRAMKRMVDAWSGASEGRSLRDGASEGRRLMDQRAKGRRDGASGGRGLRDEETAEAKRRQVADATNGLRDEEPESAAADVDSASPAQAGRGQTKGPKDIELKGERGEGTSGRRDQGTKGLKDEGPSLASRREAIRAGAWEFDTARGVDALLRGLKEYMATD